MSELAIRAVGLGKRYRIGTQRTVTTVTDSVTNLIASARARASRDNRDREFWALRDVTLELGWGEVLGIVGANGAGKSTLLKILSRITDPTRGMAEINGRMGSLLEVGTGFHPELTGRDNVYLNGAILGMRRGEIAKKFDDIVEFAGVERFIDTPVKRYSSGMYVRLAFSVAAHLEPEILLVDEVLSVGDHAFQQRCLGRMDEIAHGGRTILFVSHNLPAVSALCTRAILLRGGRVALEGRTDTVLESYLSSAPTETPQSLRERPDRHGTGELRLTGVTIRSVTGGGPAIGEDLEVRLAYAGTRQHTNVIVGVAVYGLLGEPLFLCSNNVSGEDLGHLPANGEFLCVIPRLPLAPGRYSINAYVESNGSVVDWVRDAATFDVAPGDFFGSGKLPPETHGHFMLTHSWSVEARESEFASQ